MDTDSQHEQAFGFLPGWEKMEGRKRGLQRWSVNFPQRPRVLSRVSLPAGVDQMADRSREIGSRFHDEQEYVERYVRLLRAKSTLHDRQVHDLNRILKRVQIDQL